MQRSPSSKLCAVLMSVQTLDYIVVEEWGDGGSGGLELGRQAHSVTRENTAMHSTQMNHCENMDVSASNMRKQ